MLRYVWDPFEWDGVESVPLPFSTVWTPEVGIMFLNVLELEPKFMLSGHFAQQYGGEVHVPSGGRALLHGAYCLCHRNPHQGKPLILF